MFYSGRLLHKLEVTPFSLSFQQKLAKLSTLKKSMAAHGSTPPQIFQPLVRQNNPVTDGKGGGGAEGSRKLRFPDFVTTVQGGGKVVSPKHRPSLPPGNIPGTHLC